MSSFYDLSLPNHDAVYRSQLLSNIIRENITAQHGLLSFARFMELALYHPRFGYYEAETFDISRQGDFITAPELSPLFAKCFARQTLPILEQLPTKNILELGAGTGRFAKDFLLEMEKLNQFPAHYYIYETSAHLRKKQQAFFQQACPQFLPHLTWLAHLPTDFTGIILANEVLDALPTHCFLLDHDGIKERYVTWEQDKFAWQISECSSQELKEQVQKLSTLYGLTNGYTSEINLYLPLFIKSLTTCLTQGMILLADYGYGEAEYYRPERKQGTLTCFYQHTQHADPFFFPGLQDITAHVDFTSVIENAAPYGCELAGFTTQSGFLLAGGLLEIAQEEEKNLTSLDAFHLHQAMKTLTLPTEMGETIKIMALSKNMDLVLPGFALQDRRRDL